MGVIGSDTGSMRSLGIGSVIPAIVSLTTENEAAITVSTGMVRSGDAKSEIEQVSSR